MFIKIQWLFESMVYENDTKRGSDSFRDSDGRSNTRNSVSDRAFYRDGTTYRDQNAVRNREIKLALQNLENIRRKECSNWKIAIIFMAVLVCVLIGAVTGLAIASNQSDSKYVSSDVIGKFQEHWLAKCQRFGSKVQFGSNFNYEF